MNVFCIDKHNKFITYLDNKTAYRLVQNGSAELVPARPFSIKLTVPYDKKIFNQKNKKYRVKTGLQISDRKYWNISFLDLKGDLIFISDLSKAFWYLSRDLAEIHSMKPLTLRLLFKTNGIGRKGDDFYLIPRKNICVVCGSDQYPTSHHVVPLSYRRHFPLEKKQHDNHDVLMLCCNCHVKYEKNAEVFRKQLSKKYDVPIDGFINHNLINLHKACKTLKRHGHKMPRFKYEELCNEIKSIIGHYPTPLDIEHYSRKTGNHGRFNKTNSFLIVEKLKELDEFQQFVVTWRKHFVETMSPKHLPDFWEIHRNGRK